MIRQDISAEQLAEAVTVLLERFCYDRLLLAPKGQTPDVDEMVDLLTTLWADMVRLAEP